MFDTVDIFKSSSPNGPATPKKNRQMQSTDYKRGPQNFLSHSAQKQSYVSNSIKAKTRMHDQLSSDSQEEIKELSKTIKKLRFDDNKQLREIQKFRNNVHVRGFQIQEEVEEAKQPQTSIEKQVKFNCKKFTKRESTFQRSTEFLPEMHLPETNLYRLNSMLLDNSNMNSDEYLGDNIYIKQILKQMSTTEFKNRIDVEDNNGSRFENDYEILEYIGQTHNFNGNCFKCLNKLDRIVYFVKQIQLQYQTVQTVLYPIIRSQIQIYNQDTNGHFIKFYQSWAEGKTLFLVYEPSTYTIQDMTSNKKKLTEKNIRSLIMDISSSLEYLKQKHKCNHLNLKPSNLMNCRNRYKTMDMLCNIQNKLANNNFNLKYAAPELNQFYLEQSMNYEKCDIYSLGLILLQNMTHRMQNGENTYEIKDIKNMKKILKTGFLYSPNLKRLIMRMVSLNPEKRPSFKDLSGFHEESEPRPIKRRLSL